MRVREEFTEAQRRFGLLSFYDKFEHPWFHVTADLQLITPLLQPVDTSLVLGLRSKIDF